MFKKWKQRLEARRRAKCSGLVLAVSDSLRDKPEAWAFSRTEYYLENKSASIRFVVSHESFKIERDDYTANYGIDRLELPTGTALRYLKHAYKNWLATTLAEREAERERCAAKAVVALGKQSHLKVA